MLLFVNFQILSSAFHRQWQICGRATKVRNKKRRKSRVGEKRSAVDYSETHRAASSISQQQQQQQIVTMYQEIHHTLKLADSNQYEQKSTAKICTCNKCHNNTPDICFYVPFCTIFVCLGIVQIISGIFYFITIPVIKLIFNVAIGCWVCSNYCWNEEKQISFPF